MQEFEKRWGELPTTTINEISDVKIDIFPNPSLGKVTIITESTIDVINIYDIEGKFVQSTTSNYFEILSSGVYFIKIMLDNGNFIKFLTFVLFIFYFYSFKFKVTLL